MTEETHHFEVDDYTADSDDLLDIVAVRRFQHGILITADEAFIDTLANARKKPILAVKVNFVTIPEWKVYIQLSFYIRRSALQYGPRQTHKEVIGIHEAHVFMGRECVTRSFTFLILIREEMYHLGWSTLPFLLSAWGKGLSEGATSLRGGCWNAYNFSWVFFPPVGRLRDWEIEMVGKSLLSGLNSHANDARIEILNMKNFEMLQSDAICLFFFF